METRMLLLVVLGCYRKQCKIFLNVKEASDWLVPAKVKQMIATEILLPN
jgi:hypothetical protein